jgi:hypothetical protein
VKAVILFLIHYFKVDRRFALESSGNDSCDISNGISSLIDLSTFTVPIHPREDHDPTFAHTDLAA